MSGVGLAGTTVAIEGAKPRLISHTAWIMTGFIALLVALVLASLFMGRYSLPISAWWQVFTSPDQNEQARIILLQVRLPRVIAAVMIGGALSVSGAAFQGLFRNPMASPDMFGAYAGAGFASTLAILLGYGIVGIQLMGFVGGLTAVILAWAVSAVVSRVGGDPSLTLILVGIVVREGGMALIRLVEYVADARGKLAAMTFWLVGSLSAVNMHDVEYVVLPMLIGTIATLLLRWKLNLLSFGDEEARALGVNPTYVRVVVVVAASMICASVMAIGGMILWVGLVIPHLARMVIGANHKLLLPASFLIGACYLLFVDDCARGLFAVEVPIGVLTSTIGVPFFLYLLVRTRMGRA